MQHCGCPVDYSMGHIVDSFYDVNYWTKQASPGSPGPHWQNSVPLNMVLAILSAMTRSPLLFLAVGGQAVGCLAVGGEDFDDWADWNEASHKDDLRRIRALQEYEEVAANVLGGGGSSSGPTEAELALQWSSPKRKLPRYMT